SIIKLDLYSPPLVTGSYSLTLSPLLGCDIDLQWIFDMVLPAFTDSIAWSHMSFLGYFVHCIMAMGALFSAIFWSSFVCKGVLTFLVEVSNVFLITHMMMKIHNAQDRLLYCVNKYVSLVMYFLFHLSPQVYLANFLLYYVGQRTLDSFLLSILLVLDILILIYFSHLLQFDFYPEHVSKQPHKDKFLIE
uniref:TLC domain-containing protein n=1 Tax=Oryctolagus cuniculus TaxID=9986 RepID=A0A5F9CAP7_RABIT